MALTWCLVLISILAKANCNDEVNQTDGVWPLPPLVIIQTSVVDAIDVPSLKPTNKTNTTANLNPNKYASGQLLLTPLIEAGKITEAQEAARVTGIRELENMTSYSGYFTVNKENQTNLFFWYFEAPPEAKGEHTPIVLWLQGGPGRSSLRGLFMENGPFEITPNGLNRLNSGFTNSHYMIYLDNPLGAGFSTTREWPQSITIEAVAEDLYTAILQFFQMFPDLQKHKFFIAGQSYAGKFVTVFAHLIHTRNPEAKLKINLAGIALGNGFVDPETQLENSEFLYHIGLLNLKDKLSFQEHEQKVREFINEKNWTKAYDSYQKLILDPFKALFVNMTGYSNIANILDPPMPIVKELLMESFLQRPKIKEALHVGNTTFLAANPYVMMLLLEDIMQSVAHLMPELLNNYKVLIYNGQLDILLPYVTTVQYLKKLKFAGSDSYYNAERVRWGSGSTVYGYATQVGHLTEVLIRNAGHSAPEDQLVATTQMLTSFTRGLKFDIWN